MVYYTLSPNAIEKYKEYASENIRMLNDKDEIYSYHHPYDKIYRNLLGDVNQVTKFLNNYLKPNPKLESENLEKSNTSFITSHFRNRQADIIYKMKDKNIYFLIEHQSKIDKKMPYRIWMYGVELIRAETRENLIGKKEYKIPIVIPIVLYTGKKKWNVTTNLSELQEKWEGFQGIQTITQYNLIETQNQIMLNKNDLISKIALLENVDNIKELKQNVIKISETIKQREEMDKFMGIVSYTLPQKMAEEEVDKIIERLSKKKLKDEDGEPLRGLDLLSKLFEEINDVATKNGTEQGMKQGMKQGMEQGMKQGMEQGMELGKDLLLRFFHQVFPVFFRHKLHLTPRVFTLRNRNRMKK